MCLIVFAWKVNPHIPLIAAANRDEFYERASARPGRGPNTRKCMRPATCRRAAAGRASPKPAAGSAITDCP